MLDEEPFRECEWIAEYECERALARDGLRELA